MLEYLGRIGAYALLHLLFLVRKYAVIHVCIQLLKHNYLMILMHLTYCFNLYDLL